MFYTSNNWQELNNYNIFVSESEQYDGTNTKRWANIYEHQQGGLFAILKHNKYFADLEEIESLQGWHNLEL